MVYFVLILLFCLVVGLVGVASNPAPLYGAAGLVLVAAVGCGVLVWLGGSFVSLVLFLIYLGGMLVVFIYSVALAAEPYPETWGNWVVSLYVLGYFMLVGGILVLFGGMRALDVFGIFSVDGGGLGAVRGDFMGVSLMYGVGGGYLLISGWGLLLALFVALEVSRGFDRGGLRGI